MDRLSRYPFLDEELGHLIRSMLGLREYEYISDTRILEDMHHEWIFVDSIDMIDMLCDRLGRCRYWRDLYFERIFEHAMCESRDSGSHSSREKQSLTLHRDNLEEFFHIIDESHIEHTIRLIEDEYLHIRERDISLIHEIQESSRSGDEYVDSLAETLNLLALAHSTKHDRLMESSISSIRLETLLDLDSELTSGCDDERFDLAFTELFPSS